MRSPEIDWSLKDDADLVRAVQAGTAHAFDPLVDRHLGHVHAFVALRLPVPHLVDEITHETFVSAFRLMDRFEPGTHLRAWLRAIASNLVRQELSRFRREQFHKLEFVARREIDQALATADDLEPVVTEALQKCLQSLAPLMRNLLDLRYSEGNSSEEIGSRLGRSIAWVRTTLFRVREHLRQCIELRSKGGHHAGA